MSDSRIVPFICLLCGEPLESACETCQETLEVEPDDEQAEHIEKEFERLEDFIKVVGGESEVEPDETDFKGKWDDHWDRVFRPLSFSEKIAKESIEYGSSFQPVKQMLKEAGWLKESETKQMVAEAREFLLKQQKEYIKEADYQKAILYPLEAARQRDKAYRVSGVLEALDRLQKKPTTTLQVQAEEINFSMDSVDSPSERAVKIKDLKPAGAGTPNGVTKIKWVGDNIAVVDVLWEREQANRHYSFQDKNKVLLIGRGVAEIQGQTTSFSGFNNFIILQFADDRVESWKVDTFENHLLGVLI